MAVRCVRLQEFVITQRHGARGGRRAVRKTPRRVVTRLHGESSARRRGEPTPPRPRAVYHEDALTYVSAGTRLPRGPSPAASPEPAAGDWLSGRAPRSHRGGHWFDPSIAHRCKARSETLRTALILLGGWELLPYWEEFGRPCPLPGHRGSAKESAMLCARAYG
jgi:hypothetical protein